MAAEPGGVANRPTANCNPLDLIWGAEAESFGATRGDRSAPGGYKWMSGMAVFPDVATGWRAAQGWLSVPAKTVKRTIPGFFTDPNGTTLVAGYLGATLAQVIYRFAPPNENNTEAYISYVSQNTKIPRTAVVTAEMLALPEAA